MKRKRYCLIVISLLLFLCAAYLLFRPSYIHFDMPCMEMTFEGYALESGRLQLSGLQYQEFVHGRFFTRFIPFELQIPDYQGYSPEYWGPRTIATSIYPGCLTGFFFVRDNEGVPEITSCDIVWHADGSCCVVYVDGRFFVGSYSGDYDAALELFLNVLYVGD